MCSYVTKSFRPPTPRRRWGWGYRMIHDVLRPQFPGINHKRVYRIYTAEGLRTFCRQVRVRLWS